MKFNRDVLMKVGIVAAVLLIIFLIFRSRSCKSAYAEFVPDDNYAENMYEERAADYAEEDAYTEDEEPRIENYTLMESTLADDQANAMFEPEM